MIKMQKSATLQIAISVTKQFKFRMWLALMLFRLASIILGCGVEVVGNDLERTT
jgi:hypothetical protein